MSSYSALIFDPAKGTTRREIIRGSETQVRAVAAEKGWSILSLTALKDSGGMSRGSTLNRDQQIAFCRGVALQLRAGMESADALHLYAQGLPNRFRVPLEKAAEQIRSGDSLSAALARTNLFPETFLGVVQAGDAAGAPADALLQLAEKLKVDRKLTGSLKKAAVVPCIVTLMGGAILLASQLILVPKVREVSSRALTGPDAVTDFVFGFNDVFLTLWIPVTLLIIGAILSIVFLPSVRAMVLYVLMSQIKLIRLLVMAVRQHSFVSAFRLLYTNGASLEDALVFAAKALVGTQMADELRAAAKDVVSGTALWAALKHRTSCDARLVQLIRVSEETAEFKQQLQFIEDMFAEEALDRVDNLTTVMNLLFVFLAGGLLAFVFILAYAPIVVMVVKSMG